MPYATKHSPLIVQSGPMQGKTVEELSRPCIVCKSPIPLGGRSWSQYKHKKFCSQTCMGLWAVGPHNSRWKPRPVKLCAQCGNEIYLPPDRYPSTWKQRKFCSLLCRRINHAGPLKSWQGYVVIKYDEFYRAIFEHVVKAEAALGRKMKRSECVHHINGNRSDNRNDNLLICSRSYHTWLHQEMGRRYMLDHFGGR